MAPAGQDVQHAAEFVDEHGEHGIADRERELADREARDAETDPREPEAGMKSHHQIRRSIPPVRPVRQNPYPQVRVYRLSDAAFGSGAV
jgi:hypothetical protein